MTCDQAIVAGGRCSNKVCHYPPSERYFSWNQAIAMRSGVLEEAINRYKYQDQKGWGMIFGRVVTGFLNENGHLVESIDHIIPSPTFVGTAPGERRWDHTRYIAEMAAAADEDDRWPFYLDPPALIEKVAHTPSLVKAGSWNNRRDIAVNEIRPALRIPDPSLTRNKRILVIDDVFTEGLNLNEVARALAKDGGAAEVCGLTLARQGWG